jgi:hypothetical protein
MDAEWRFAKEFWKREEAVGEYRAALDRQAEAWR